MLVRIGICIAALGWSLFSYLDKNNEVTKLKIRLPEIEKKLSLIREETRRLRLDVEQFENPTHLIELAHRPEYGHLKHPLLREILTVPEAIAAND